MHNVCILMHITQGRLFLFSSLVVQLNHSEFCIIILIFPTEAPQGQNIECLFITQNNATDNLI